jgi:hypothetical protein
LAEVASTCGQTSIDATRCKRLVTTERREVSREEDELYRTERELNRLIEKRARDFAANAAEETERWERSLREYRERQRVERLEAWMVWHQSRARGFDRLSTEHREKAAQLAEQLMELEFEEGV